MSRKIILLTLSTFVLIAAGIAVWKKYFHEKEIPAGGPCSYDKEYFRARILTIDLIQPDSSQVDITFEIDYDGLLDTINYSEANSSYFNVQSDTNEIDTGRFVRYVHEYITEGSCSPDFFYFDLQPYVSR